MAKKQEGKLKITQEFITPDISATYLKLNKNWRKPECKNYVPRIARQMAKGEWDYNGDPIRFNTAGDLVDGQHRLLACIMADEKYGKESKFKGFWSVVIRGIKSDMYIDSGRKRNYVQLLASRGEKAPSDLAAALRLIYLARKGKLQAVKSGCGLPPIYKQLDDLLNSEPTIREWMKHAMRLYSGLRHFITRSRVAGLGFLFSEKDAADAEFFFNELAKADSTLSPKHPIVRLRSVLKENANAQFKMSRSRMFGFVIKAWNFLRRDQMIDVLQFRQTGPRPEHYPEIN